jgi:hypothetical protein
MISTAMAAVVISKRKNKGSEVGINNHLDHTATTSSSPALFNANSTHYVLRFDSLFSMASPIFTANV